MKADSVRAVYRFPLMSPRRLVREAIRGLTLVYLRRGELPPEELRKLNPRTGDWGQIVGLVCAPLRHRYSDYNERLARGEDHDTLRAQIDGAIHRSYPWLSRDPRLFAPEPARLALDARAAELEEPQGYFQELIELLRVPASLPVRDQLRSKLARYRDAIDAITALLTQPWYFEDGVIFRIWPTRDGKDYDWAGHALHPNSLVHAGFKCAGCAQGVYRTKRALPIGQGRRGIVYSCHCAYILLPAPPPGKRLLPLVAETWTDKITELSAFDRLEGEG
jgi:hypothetical protein